MLGHWSLVRGQEAPISLRMKSMSRYIFVKSRLLHLPRGSTNMHCPPRDETVKV